MEEKQRVSPSDTSVHSSKTQQSETLTVNVDVHQAAVPLNVSEGRQTSFPIKLPPITSRSEGIPSLLNPNTSENDTTRFKPGGSVKAWVLPENVAELLNTGRSSSTDNIYEEVEELGPRSKSYESHVKAWSESPKNVKVSQQVDLDVIEVLSSSPQDADNSPQDADNLPQDADNPPRDADNLPPATENPLGIPLSQNSCHNRFVEFWFTIMDLVNLESLYCDMAFLFASVLFLGALSIILGKFTSHAMSGFIVMIIFIILASTFALLMVAIMITYYVCKEELLARSTRYRRRARVYVE